MIRSPACLQMTWHVYPPSQLWLWWRHSSRVISLHSSYCSPPSTPLYAPSSPSPGLPFTACCDPSCTSRSPQQTLGVWRGSGVQCTTLAAPPSLCAVSAHEVYNCLLLASWASSSAVQCHWLDATNWQGLVFTLLFPAIAPFPTDIHTPPSLQCALFIHSFFLALKRSELLNYQIYVLIIYCLPKFL